MGLDNYAAHSPDDIELTEEDLQAFQDANIELCGGVFSGCDGSFRGKVYESYVREITGESLYAPWLPPETVKEMFHALTDFENERWHIDQDSLPEDSDHSDLWRFFKVCSERGLGLVGWS